VREAHQGSLWEASVEYRHQGCASQLVSPRPVQLSFIAAGAIVLLQGVTGLLMNGRTLPNLKRGANGTLSSRKLHRFSAITSAPVVLLTVLSGMVSMCAIGWLPTLKRHCIDCVICLC